MLCASTSSTATGVITVPEPALGTADGYFPMLPVGRTWTYTYNNGGSTEIIKAADTTTLKHTLGTVTSSDIFSFPSTGGVLLTSISADTTTSLYVPGLPIFPVNIVAGSAAKPTSYTVTVSGTTPIEHTVTLTVAGVEATRTVPAGTFNNVLHIHTANIPSGEGTLKADSWYARGVGLIEDTDKKLSVYIDSTGISHP